MKKLYPFLMMLAALPLLWSCGDDDPEDEDRVNPTPSVSVTLRSQSISEGAEVDARSTTQLVLTYSVSVKLASNHGITVNGVAADAQRNPQDVTAILIPLTLEEGSSYVVSVPQGAVVASSDATASAPALTLHFTTKAKEEVVTNIQKDAMFSRANTLYHYMLEQYGQKVISSVMADVNWNTRIAEKVKTLTGKYPAMNCFDFIHIYVPQNNWIDYTNITPVKQWADAGGIVSLMWHFNVPVDEATASALKTDGSGVTCDPSKTTFKAANALVEGTWENRWFYQEMDKVVSVVLKLQQEGIAALWRPFHEAAGNATLKSGASWGKAWFWWGSDGAETYKKLWFAMFDYFKRQGVENLIWVWTTQNHNGNSEQYNQDRAWYPEGYVDMVARDLYGYDAARNVQEFNEIQAAYPDKMVVLGECGKGDSGEQGLIGDCFRQGAQWGHFMVWYQGGQGSTDTMCSDAWWRDAMQSSLVITRDQLPSLK